MNNDRLNFRRPLFYKGKFDSFQYVNVGDEASFSPGPNNEFTCGPWEQCTDSRDKNGNLIYESDVVQLRAEDNTFISAVVVWQNGCFCPGDDEPFGDSSMWEIIGNIHEQK